ncbi:coordinator of PRMT5 and differentiation stimulator isoform X1 [Monodelphis domestica]|uniref:coordinator of PRMT5 and differentiation stimulator isoform X1 n=1 Tax=Monodelphis domestica TaxID=13616 RepID=UPI0024E24FB6|nr:coordinator of PRMT5 and differentiation stimulator isoform X1 [Monodelphis domestica]
MGRCGRQAPPRTGHVTRTLPLASHWPFRVAFRPAAWGGRHVGAAAAAAPAPQGLAGMEPRAAGTGGGWRPAASEGESQLPLAARALEEEAPSEPEPEPQPQEEPPRAAAVRPEASLSPPPTPRPPETEARRDRDRRGTATSPHGPSGSGASGPELGWEVNLAMSDHFYQKKEGDEDEVMKWRPKLACGAQNVPILGEVDHPDEDEVQDYGDSEEDLNWELEDRVENSLPPEPRAEPPVKEDWDTELILDQGNPYGAEDIHRASIQDFCLWAPRAQQGDLIYDPSWHHPAPLTPHYSKMVFETGQFDDAED